MALSAKNPLQTNRPLIPTGRIPHFLFQFGILLFGFSFSSLAIGDPKRDQQTILTSGIKNKLTVIRTELIEAARLSQIHELTIIQAEKQLIQLKRDYNNLTMNLKTSKDQISNLTMTLQRLIQMPPELILLRSKSPLEASKALMVTKFLIHSLALKIKNAENKLKDVNHLDKKIREKKSISQNSNQQLANLKNKLDALLKDKNIVLNNKIKSPLANSSFQEHLRTAKISLEQLLIDLKKRESNYTEIVQAPLAKTSQRPIQSLLEQSNYLYDLSSTKVHHKRSFMIRKGRLTFPAAGEIIKRFGQTDSFGIKTKGITIRTHPQARVVSSYDGKVLYAGQYRNYGGTIIIEHESHLHTLLIGLGRIDVQTGQLVLAGEPVGVMTRSKMHSNLSREDLYIEIRNDGNPTDPLVWFPIKRNVTYR